ncbi:isopentenyl-diphosphate Delta-isomerase 1-like [Hyposmocoma kahamanoa]|uniref:isopentenyl-diphosphate Delta-isomerase 1-like n=1 Tax=Hyposmocoma kahamanoa TaxID=1477025 RepID=UPI000E6D8772|nr:isopentenyl-diphosphate Delta-isomerase 1-like [Hyposmocoma kahamanoa]
MNLMTRIHYHDPFDGVWGEHEMDYILVMQADLDIEFNPNEIEEFHCVPRNEFDDFMASLEGPVTPWFNMICRNRLQFWWDNLNRLKEIATPEKIETLEHNRKINKY